MMRRNNYCTSVLLLALTMLWSDVEGFYLTSSMVDNSQKVTTTNLNGKTLLSSQIATPISALGNAAASNANEMMPMKRGSSVALVTPMKPHGDLDLPALERLLEWHVEAGTDNLCILGTTGEANTLTMKEREAVLTTAVKVCKGKMPILVGCGTIDPHYVKEMTMQAMDLGCDASLVVTPYYVKPPQRALIQHFTFAADLGLPVVVYNVPGRTGVNLQDDSMAILAQHDNIVGLKDATGDLSRLDSLKALLQNDDNLLLYSGDDGTSKDFAVNGGDGCISVTANVAPTAMHQMMEAAFSGDDELATQINDPIDILHSQLFCEANPIPVKWAVYRQGHIVSPYCRPPLATLDEQFQAVLDKSLHQAGVLDHLNNHQP